jgi:hypothetical protein
MPFPHVANASQVEDAWSLEHGCPSAAIAGQMPGLLGQVPTRQSVEPPHV